MIQRRQSSRFTLPPRAPFGIGGNEIRQDFESNVPFERGVAGAEDTAHPALAEKGRNLICADS
jgi:hypothetical protein